jgi:hypothetical protein
VKAQAQFAVASDAKLAWMLWMPISLGVPSRRATRRITRQSARRRWSAWAEIVALEADHQATVELEDGRHWKLPMPADVDLPVGARVLVIAREGETTMFVPPQPNADGTLTIYVELKDEGGDVWRPVRARPVTSETFRLPASAPDGEIWRFPLGALVGIRIAQMGVNAVFVATAIRDQ